MNTFLKENKKPLLVGITGGIGSGKTTVSKIFGALGIPIFNSDVEAKKIVNNNVNVIKQIKTAFGNVYDENGLDNKQLSAIVFKDKKALEKLNKIVHPIVAQNFEHWIEEHKNSKILMKEAAILIESGAYKSLDEIILIIAPKEKRIERVIRRDGVLLEDIKVRIDKQLTDEEKTKYANYLINNNEEQLLIPQVLKVYEQLKSRN